MTSNNTLPKFKKGDKVVYLPTLTGLDKNHTFEISLVYFKEHDDLFAALGVEFTPQWYYTFVDSHLHAVETDLK